MGWMSGLKKLEPLSMQTFVHAQERPSGERKTFLPDQGLPMDCLEVMSLLGALQASYGHGGQRLDQP